MKILNIIILLTTIILISCSSESTVSSESTENPDWAIGLREEVKDDTVFFYDDNNTVRLKAPIHNGKINGEAFTYYDDGRLLAIATYVNGTLQGTMKEYYSSGKLKTESMYYDGLKTGEHLKFYDGYEDSTVRVINGTPWIGVIPTKLEEFRFYYLGEDKLLYYRKYDLEGNLVEQKGRVLNMPYSSIIRAKTGEKFFQAWITPAPYHLPQTNIKQHVIITNLSDPSIPKDTVYPSSDSTITRWTSKIDKIGEYRMQAVSYLIEKGNVETDTSNFKVVIEK